MTIRRGTGLLPEDGHAVAAGNRDFPLAAIVGGAPRPLVIDYRYLLDDILDQGDTNACVGCSFSTAVYLRGRLTTPVRRPSPKLFYDLARIVAFGERNMRDVGCRPIDAILGSHARGLVAAEDWPLFTSDPELLALAGAEGKAWIDTPPPFDVYHSAYDARLVGYMRADEGDIIRNIESALHIGQIPSWGLRMAGDYGDVRGAEIYDAPAMSDTAIMALPEAHMQAIIGYDADAFLVASSWGRGHGDGGIVRVRKTLVADHRWSFARIVVTSVPKSYI